MSRMEGGEDMTQDQLAIEESINESMKHPMEEIHDEETALQTNQHNAHLGHAQADDEEIVGFEDIPDSAIMRLSYVRLIQPTSKKVLLADGQHEASPGQFFFNDTLEAVDSLEICYLTAKIVTVNFPKKDGTPDWKKQMKVLAITTQDPKTVIVLTLSLSSFGQFGKFKRAVKQKKARAGYEYKVLLSSHREENEQGKYYVVDFELGERNSEDDLLELSRVFFDYKNALEKPSDEEAKQFQTQPEFVSNPEPTPF